MSQLKPPSYFLDQISSIDLFYKDKLINTWDQILTYSDLDFKVTDSSGYWIKVKLKRVMVWNIYLRKNP